MTESNLGRTASEVVGTNKIVLAMRGNRHTTQCQVSGDVARLLEMLGVHYRVADLEAEPHLVEGFASLSGNAPLPLLFVNEQYIGDGEAVKARMWAGALVSVLGIAVPQIVMTPCAAEHIREVQSNATNENVVHLGVAPFHDGHLVWGPRRLEEFAANVHSLEIWMDAASARRAEGVVIDWIEMPTGMGEFVVHHPKAPRVRSLSAKIAGALVQSDRSFELLDVRSDKERAIASIAKSSWLDDAEERVFRLPKSTLIVLYSHLGTRGQHIAEALAQRGFYNCWNLFGGIDAYAKDADRSVPRYEGGTA